MLLSEVRHGRGESKAEVILRLPITVNYPDGNFTRVIFELHYKEPALEAVVRFCSHYNIVAEMCSTLKNTVMHQITENVDANSNFIVGTNNATRLIDAFANQYDYDRINDISVSSPIQIPTTVKRIIIIHSCTFQDQRYDILGDMLYRIEQSGLLQSVDGIWVMNYGAVRSVPSCTDRFINTETCIRSPDKVHIVQVAPHCGKFEAPTMTFIYDLSHNLSRDAQILYMHNKGASYVEIPQSITNYRNMMMFFLVEKHEACYYLLRSSVLDVLGINVRNRVGGHGHFFSGNFWWATAGYVSSIPQFLFGDKYAAERFILSHPYPRVYSLYESGTDDINALHPRESYAGKESGKQCFNLNYCI